MSHSWRIIRDVRERSRGYLTCCCCCRLVGCLASKPIHIADSLCLHRSRSGSDLQMRKRCLDFRCWGHQPQAGEKRWSNPQSSNFEQVYVQGVGEKTGTLANIQPLGLSKRPQKATKQVLTQPWSTSQEEDWEFHRQKTGHGCPVPQKWESLANPVKPLQHSKEGLRP